MTTILKHELLPLSHVLELAKQAGFRGNDLINAVAIACAESGLDPDAFGDRDLADAKWGPSVGLWQIRSLNKDYRTKRTRDEDALLDPAFNARSAYAISGGGRDFGPWSTYDKSTKHPKNDGSYRKFLDAAIVAFNNSPAMPGVEAGTIPTKPADTGIPMAIAKQGGPVVPLTIGGRSLTGALGEAVISGTVDLTTSEVSEVSLTLLDPGFELSKRHRLDLDSTLHCLGLPFRVTSLSCGQHPAGPTVSLKAHPSGAVAMRVGSPTSVNNVTPTDYMASVARGSGLRFIGQPSGVRASIGPTQVQASEGTRAETAWEIGQRLSDELGYYAFEAAGTYYFASTKYIKSHASRVQLVGPYGRAYPTSTRGVVYETIETPDCTATQSKSVPPVLRANRNSIYYCDVQVTAKVGRDNGESLRTALNATLAGVSPKFEGTDALITKVSWDLVDSNAPVDVTAGTLAAKNGTNVTAADYVVDPNDPTIVWVTGSRATGSKSRSALDFVSLCLAQVGDKYIFGTEVDLNDADPDAFDCSELIQWACSRVGVSFVDGSANQWGAMVRAGTTLTVTQASRTRGALLYKPGHIVVSLGDGKHTVEAKGAKYGVVQGSISGRGWTGGGKVPGLVYG